MKPRNKTVREIARVESILRTRKNNNKLTEIVMFILESFKGSLKINSSIIGVKNIIRSTLSVFRSMGLCLGSESKITNRAITGIVQITPATI
jgi:hypothetical protein